MSMGLLGYEYVKWDRFIKMERKRHTLEKDEEQIALQCNGICFKWSRPNYCYP